MNTAVEKGIDEIRAAFPGNEIDVEPDPDGGAYVRVHNVHLGEQYAPCISWIAFHITFQYPHADVYPHFCEPDLKKNGTDVASPFNRGEWKTPSVTEKATSISRRSKNRDPAIDTAAIKLMKVLEWIHNQ